MKKFKEIHSLVSVQALTEHMSGQSDTKCHCMGSYHNAPVMSPTIEQHRCIWQNPWSLKRPVMSSHDGSSKAWTPQWWWDAEVFTCWLTELQYAGRLSKTFCSKKPKIVLLHEAEMCFFFTDPSAEVHSLASVPVLFYVCPKLEPPPTYR